MPTIRKRKSKSFQRTIVRIIINAAARGDYLDRKFITQLAVNTFGYVCNATGYYRILGIVLHFIRTRVNHELFDSWTKETGLDVYLAQIVYKEQSSYWITFQAIFDPSLAHLFIPYAKEMDQFNEQVMKRIVGHDGPFTVVDMQCVRGAKGFLFTCIDILDSYKHPKWKQIKAELRLPKQKKGSYGKSTRPAKLDVTPNDCLPMSWLGSKRRSVHHITGKFDLGKHDRFIEPFAGTAVTTLMLRSRRPDLTCWINDAYTPLSRFYVALRDTPEALVDRLLKEPPDEARWKEYHAALPETQDPWMLYYLITYSYGQLGNNYDAIHSAKPKRFFTASRLLKGVKITNLDFRDVIDEEGTIFADPPWVNGKPSPFYHPFTEQDHRDLSVSLRKREEPWVLTCDDCPMIRKMYEGCKMLPLRSRRTLGWNGAKSVMDLLISPF
jgi:site-specific DNA-adenine methylase